MSGDFTELVAITKLNFLLASKEKSTDQVTFNHQNNFLTTLNAEKFEIEVLLNLMPSEESLMMAWCFTVFLHCRRDTTSLDFFFFFAKAIILIIVF